MATRPRIMITGIAGNLGRYVAKAMHRDYQVIGVDRRPFAQRPKDVEHHQIDIRRNAAEGLFRKRNVQAVIHLNIMHNPRANLNEHYTFNLYGTQKLLEYCIKYGVQKFVFLSSANIYGPRPESSGYLAEDSPLMASQAFSGIQDLIAVDLLVQSFFWKHPQLQVVILRPCHIIGQGIQNAPTNYLRLEPPMTLLGFDPLIQLIHVDDVVQGMQRALDVEARGIYNLAGPGVVPLSTLHRQLGHKPIPVPEPIARKVLETLWKSRLTSFPPPELAHIRYACLVDDARARRELGYAPQVDLPRIVKTLRQI
jgi:UDP-glucose 4-epimerase